MKRLMIAAAAALATSACAAHPADDVIRGGPAPSPKRRLGSAPVPKTPNTAHDHARLQRAEQKRMRKAARLRALVAGGAIGEAP